MRSITLWSAPSLRTPPTNHHFLGGGVGQVSIWTLSSLMKLQASAWGTESRKSLQSLSQCPRWHFPPAILRSGPLKHSSPFLIIASIVKSLSLTVAPLANHCLSFFINLRLGTRSPVITVLEVTKTACQAGVGAASSAGPDLEKNYACADWSRLSFCGPLSRPCRPHSRTPAPRPAPQPRLG